MSIVDHLAVKVCLRHTPENEIPAEFKPGYNPQNQTRKVKEDSKTRTNYLMRIEQTRVLLHHLHKHFGDKIIQIVDLKPKPHKGLKHVTDHPLWSELNLYLQEYRDKHPENHFEIGTISMLLFDLQRTIEVKFNLVTNYTNEKPATQDKPKKEVKLKDALAQELYDKGVETIDGVVVKFWQGHTYDTVKAQQGWNKIRSYTEQNAMSLGMSGSVVFSGIMQIPRIEIMDIASQMGFLVHEDISSKTTLFVIGSENVAPNEVARYIRQREKRSSIKIMNEIDFLQMAIDWIGI